MLEAEKIGAAGEEVSSVGEAVEADHIGVQQGAEGLHTSAYVSI